RDNQRIARFLARNRRLLIDSTCWIGPWVTAAPYRAESAGLTPRPALNIVQAGRGHSLNPANLSRSSPWPALHGVVTTPRCDRQVCGLPARSCTCTRLLTFFWLSHCRSGPSWRLVLCHASSY